MVHDAAGFFTFLLVMVALVQAGLFFWQLKIMRDGIEDTRIAALAAKASAESAKEQVAITKLGVIDLERAYFAVGPGSQSYDYIKTSAALARGHYISSDPMEVTVILTLTNTGRTGGTLKKVYGEFSQTPPLGDKPVYKNGDSVPADFAIQAHESILLTPFEFKDGFIGPQFFWGYIEYEDIFRNKRISRFCNRIVPERHPSKGKFQLAGSDGWRECD